MQSSGELRILVNPEELDAAAGAAFLSRCFATRWTAEMYRWYLERPFAGELPDQLIVTEDGRTLAACGVAYRLLRTQDGEVHRVGIAVAGGTLPSARGRGCFGHVLQALAERAAARGCTALLGFLSAGNFSERSFLRLGAVATPSAYIVSSDRSPGPLSDGLQLREAQVVDDWPRRAEARLTAPAAPGGFHYPDAGAWRSQIVDRPDGVQALRIGATCRAVVETVGDTDRLQWLDGDGRERLGAIRSVAVRARRHGHKFFMYSTCPHEAAAARRLGLVTRPGYFMAVPLQTRRASAVRDWGGMSWRIHSGDRM